MQNIGLFVKAECINFKHRAKTYSFNHTSYAFCFRKEAYFVNAEKYRLQGFDNVIVNAINGPLTRYVKLLVEHAPWMPGTFSPPPCVSDRNMNHGTCVMHVPWCMPGSLTSGFLWSWWRGKRSRHSQRMHNPHFYVSGKRPMRTRIILDTDMRYLIPTLTHSPAFITLS